MVQQTKDSTFTEYGLAHAEPGLSNSDRQLSISIAGKRTELVASHNESTMAVSKTIESADEDVKNSGTIRPIRSPPKSNGGSRHIVYVRRKPESELAKSNISDALISAANCLDKKKCIDQDEATQPLKRKNEPLHGASSPSFSSTRRSVSPSVGVSSNTPSPEDVKQGGANCMNPPSEDPEMASVARWQEQYSRLLSLLKTLDQSDQYEYVQSMSLSYCSICKLLVFYCFQY